MPEIAKNLNLDQLFSPISPTSRRARDLGVGLKERSIRNLPDRKSVCGWQLRSHIYSYLLISTHIYSAPTSFMCITCFKS